MRTFIGIDLGLTGAIAAISEEKVQVFDMPILEKMSAKERSTIDVDGIVDLIAEIKSGYAYAAIELLHPQPRPISAVANFSMGESLGIIKAIFTILAIPYTLPTPAKWKKYMGVNAHKDLSRQVAMELFPDLSPKLKLKKDHGRSEALLLAEFARRTYGK